MNRTCPSDVAVLSCASAGVPAAERASACWRSYSATTSASSRRSAMRSRVDARHRPKHVANALGVVKKERAREVRNLQRAEDRPLAPRIEHPGSDHCPAAATGPARPRLRLVRERHAVPLARRRASGRARGRGRTCGRRLRSPPRAVRSSRAASEAARGSATRARGARDSPSTPTGNRRRCRGSLRSRDAFDGSHEARWYPPPRSAALGGESAVP